MPGQPPLLSARNPYALAETVLNHPIDWSSIEDKRAFLEEVLQTPYEHLFDPKYGGPVYLGTNLREGQVKPIEYRTPQAPTAPENDGEPLLPEDVVHLTDLSNVLGDLKEVTVRSAAPARAGGWLVEVAAGGAFADRLRDAVFDRSVLDRLISVVQGLDWTPSGGQWADTGEFFDEAAEYFDPVQGALADCWLIAAMSSVAWALPGQISDRSRATGPADSQFKHMFSYRNPDDGTVHQFEAGDQIVVYQGTTWPMYGRSSEPGEIWPAVIEKAFAQWRQGTTSDHPNMTVLNYGDCVWASAALSGRTPQYVGHAGQTGTQLAQLVKSHSQSYRTVDPMTAWTYDTAPAGLSYTDANIVGNHCYSVLGWTTGLLLRRALNATFARLDTLARDAVLSRHGAARLLDPFWLSRDFVVLRNPWGSTEGTAGALHGSITLRDEDFWRYLDLDVDDGVFAMDFASYQKYFAGTGVAV